MFALTGDRMDLRFTVNGAPMGSVVRGTGKNRIDFALEAGGPIDCVDLLRDGELVRRLSTGEVPAADPISEPVHTKLVLELGWGARHRSHAWQVEFGISDGEILAVEPRFRGREVVSPVEAEDEGDSLFESRVLERGERSVAFETVTRGNPTNFTPATQGLCLEVVLPAGATVFADFGDRRVEWPLQALFAGARSGRLRDIASPTWRFHRAPLPHQWKWRGSWTDSFDGETSYYLRVRQGNDQWAWGSPVFLRGG